MPSSAVLQPRPMEYLFLQVRLPGRQPENAGVILFDPESGDLRMQLRRDWDSFASSEAEVLSELEAHLEDEARKCGGAAFLAFLEEHLNHLVCLTKREHTVAADIDARLRRLYRENINEAGAIPVLNLKAAAGYLSEEAVAPAGEPEKFIAKVVGRSMEPLIPDGSYCLFHKYRGGRRDGKKVLVWRKGITDETAQFTVKIYRSEKIQHEDGTWEHDRIRMVPLNPEFEEWLLEPEEFRVIGEFIRVLPPEE